MAKIYTRTGDDGTTGLIGGERVSKNDARIDCYGTVDELNAAIGLAACAVAAAGDRAMRDRLQRVQNELFVIGAQLAVSGKSMGGGIAAGLPAIDETHISRLEAEIDAAESQIAPLRQFILPGGSELSARLHLARTICRRAERLAVALEQAQSPQAPAVPNVVRYLNRLSDWLFVQARLANHLAGVADIPWQQ